MYIQELYPRIKRNFIWKLKQSQTFSGAVFEKWGDEAEVPHPLTPPTVGLKPFRSAAPLPGPGEGQRGMNDFTPVSPLSRFGERGE